MENELIPKDKKGKNTDLQSSIDLKTVGDAKSRFETARKRLLDPGNWHELAGVGTASFQIFRLGKKDGLPPVKQGDYIRINIPGPGSTTGDGYDWVLVELIQELIGEAEPEQIVGMKLRTCSNPQNEEEDTAHFFEEGATSSFLISQMEKKLTASYHGRNEKINNDTENIKDNIRNTAVGLGAIAGLSELQWSRLIKSFLEDEGQ
jgi:hypothetical protein